VKGRLAALTAVIIWGVQFSVLASALRHVDAYTFSGMRFALGASVLALVLWIREGRGALRFEGRALAAFGYGAAGFAAPVDRRVGVYLAAERGPVRRDLPDPHPAAALGV
jgi:drug/metabolite transporter (DMT)-like permease